MQYTWYKLIFLLNAVYTLPPSSPWSSLCFKMTTYYISKSLIFRHRFVLSSIAIWKKNIYIVIIYINIIDITRIIDSWNIKINIYIGLYASNVYTLCLFLYIMYNNYDTVHCIYICLNPFVIRHFAGGVISRNYFVISVMRLESSPGKISLTREWKLYSVHKWQKLYQCQS